MKNFKLNETTVKKFMGVRPLHNIEEKYSLKIYFQQFFALATCVTFIAMFIISYSNGNQYIDYTILDGLSTNLPLRTIRALLPVFMTWYVFFSIWAIKTGWDYLESGKIGKGICLILSFFPIFPIINIYFASCNITKNSLKYYKDLLFKQDDELKQYYRWTGWRRWVLLGELIILLPVAAFVFMQDVQGGADPSNTHYQSLWFSSFNYFTIQTNIMILLFAAYSFALPASKVFKNNNLQITMIVYIFIVGVCWTGMLLPTSIQDGSFAKNSSFEKARTFWYHTVTPTVFIACSCVLMFFKPVKVVTNFATLFKISMVYPTMYITFIAIVPFTAGVSIYGKFTNLNPYLQLNGTPGSYWFAFLVVGFWFVFFGLIYLMWYLDKKINLPKIQENRILIETAQTYKLPMTSSVEQIVEHNPIEITN